MAKIQLAKQGTIVSALPTAPTFPAIAAHAVTITIASPGVVTWNAHGIAAGRPIVLATSGSLPTGLVAGTTYYVVNPTTNDFQLATTVGGAAINTTGSQSGAHTATHNLDNTEQNNVRAYLSSFYGVDDPTNPIRTVDAPFVPHVSPENYAAAAQSKIAEFDTYFQSAVYGAWLTRAVSSARSLLYGRAIGIDISVTANATLGDENNATMFDFTSGSGIYGFITDAIFSIYAATPSTGIHRVDLRSAPSANGKWHAYMPSLVGNVSILQVRFEKPLPFSPGDLINVGFSLVAGSAAGYKGACSVLGFVE